MTVPIELPINPPIGRGVSTNHKSSNKIELSQLGINPNTSKPKGIAFNA